MARPPEGPRRRTSLVLASLCATTALFALTAAPALAAQAHVFSTSFGTAGSGDGQLSSAIGTATTTTPLLDQPLSGPVYAVSGSGKLPRWPSSWPAR